MATETECNIYEQAQDLAVTLANQDGWEAHKEAFNSQHLNHRVRSYFDKACEILAQLQGHEMSDIVAEVEHFKAEEIEKSEKLDSLEKFLRSLDLPDQEWLSPVQAKHIAKQLTLNGFCEAN
jgi:hypothetical protein